MSGESQPLGSLEVALQNAARLLSSRPALAAEQAAEILRVVPGHPGAMLLLAGAQRADGDAPAALATLQRAVALNPDFPDAWLALADHLTAIGDAPGADAAYARHLKAATQDPRLLAPAAALVENRIPEAEALLRAHLRAHPTDVAALRMLAEVAARLRRWRDSQTLLERCLELAPGFDAARHNYVTILNRQGKAAAALPQVERLLAREPRNPAYRNLKAAVLANLADYAGSARIYAEVLAEHPQQARVWMSYGHSLKTSGRLTEAVAAYRHAIEAESGLGEAWWSLANLKTVHFTPADVRALREALARQDLRDEDRLHFEFALGKALEDQAAYEESFAHYAAGNALRRTSHPYDAQANAGFVRGLRTLFTREFFAARAGSGLGARDPIFIVGLPRAGSTLIEQILASHSRVEGTMELPDIPQIARELAWHDGQDEQERFFEAVAALSGPQLRRLGERYLDGTRAFRKRATPHFIDKMPNNWLYAGLIQLILPNATIIDARRHPMGCCFSCFKQHFARGQSFTYALEDLGSCYRDYVALMHHFDAVLPGRVHRVFHEDMVANTEAEVRRLLAHCGLGFEDDCLRFYDNERAVRTASSEQVRQPIFTTGLEQWRHYEPWLGSLKAALGSVLTAYPQVPADVTIELQERP